MLAASINKLIFSYTCALYGVPEFSPLTEDHPQNPISPYASSKWMVERILDDFDIAYNLKCVSFRYFNAAGANPNGLLSEDHIPETHVIPLVLLAALGKSEYIFIFSTDYPTPDRTCIRDYIHLNDLAQAHILGLQYLLNRGENKVFNLGNGNGFTLLQLIETAQEVTGKDIQIIERDHRLGDQPILVGSSDKVRTKLGFNPKYPHLHKIITHA
jgi:UDP-glucose 4-epimerase